MRTLDLIDLTSEVRIMVQRDVAKLYASDEVYENVKQSAHLSVPRWVAEKLVMAGIASYVERELDNSSLAQIEWRERRNVAELTRLPENFYTSVRLLLKKLRSTDSNQEREVEGRLKDIVSIRVAKLLAMASKGLAADKIKNIEPEELSLYLDIKSTLDRWMDGLGLRGWST